MANPPADAAPPALFNSHCASETLEERLKTPQKLRVAELRAALQAEGLPVSGKKAELIERLVEARRVRTDEDASSSTGKQTQKRKMRSARAAAADKAAVKEARSVEHIAEYEDLEESDGEDWIDVDGDDEVVEMTPPAMKKPRQRAA